MIGFLSFILGIITGAVGVVWLLWYLVRDTPGNRV